MTAISDSQSVKFNSRGLVLLTSLLLVFIGAAAAKDHNSMKPTNKPHVVAHIQFDGMSEVDMTIQTRPGDRYYLYVQHSKGEGVSIIDISRPEKPKAIGVLHEGDAAGDGKMIITGNLAIVSEPRIGPTFGQGSKRVMEIFRQSSLSDRLRHHRARLMDAEFSKYEAYFGRGADFTLEARANATPAVSVGRFPAVSTGFFRRFVTPVHDRVVYVTYGMSSKPMRVPEAERDIYPSAIELIASCKGPYVGERDGTDMVSIHLQALAALPFETETFFGPMHTAALEEPISPNSNMSAFFFAVPDGISMSRLCSCTPAAQLVVSVMPITTAERSFAVANGSEKLVELFEKNKVPNLFDPFRRSVV